jgi:hypothetical protein
VQQRRLGSGLSVVVLLVLAVALATSPDDPSVLVAPDVYLALPTGEGAGGERPPNHCLQWQPGFPIDANVTLQGLRHGRDDPAQPAEHVVAPGTHTVPVHLATGTDRACTEGGNTNESDRGH